MAMVAEMGCGMLGQPPTSFTPCKHMEIGCPYRADDVMSPEQAVSTGTTIMAVAYNGGVVLGADTRTSTGDYVANRASRKISKVMDNIFVCRCGSAADTLSHRLRPKLLGAACCGDWQATYSQHCR